MAPTHQYVGVCVRVCVMGVLGVSLSVHTLDRSVYNTAFVQTETHFGLL